MPVAFPAIRPTNRTVTHAQFPVKRFTFSSGNGATRRYGTQSHTQPIEFEFTNITDAQADQIVVAYDAAYGTYDTLTLPSQLWDDIEEPLRSMLRGTFSWRFSGPPVISKSGIPGLKNARLTLEGQRDSSSTLVTGPAAWGPLGPIASTMISYDIQWEQRETQVFTDFTDKLLFNQGTQPITTVLQGYTRSSQWRQMSATNVNSWIYVNQVKNTFQRSPTVGTLGNLIGNTVTMLPMPLGISAYSAISPSLPSQGYSTPVTAIGSSLFTFTSPFAVAGDFINVGIPFIPTASYGIFGTFATPPVIMTDFNSGDSTEPYPKSGATRIELDHAYPHFYAINKGGPTYIPQMSGTGPNFYTGSMTTYAYVRNFKIRIHGTNDPFVDASPGLPNNGNLINFITIWS